MEPETLEGLVVELVFQNQSNGYTVCDLDCDGVIQTVVGYMPGLAVGETVRLSGNWTSHPEYGEQFKAEYFEKLAPSGEGAVLLYLSSGIISGVRESTARKIVDKFGENALDIIATEPERLATIKGISLDKARKIGASYLEKQGAQNVVMFLQPYGVSPDMAMRVYQTLGADAVAHIKHDPYILCDIQGVGFPTADKIALAMDTAQNHPGRIKSGIKYVLSQVAVTSGHTYLPHDELLGYAHQALGIDDEAEIENQLVALLASHRVRMAESYDGQKRYALAVYDRAEKTIARKIISLKGERQDCDEAIERGIKKTEDEDGIELSEEQRDAVRAAVTQGVLVITGGPGTGKTTIIKAILNIIEDMGQTIALAAPTGRAAKRMTDTCNREAKTIHRLLEAGYSDDESGMMKFYRDEKNPIEADCVIVDEMSMVDVLLMGSLSAAIAPGTRLIMVGDVDQLPPVGAGDVLKDLIDSQTVSVMRLSHIYRQAAQSMIVQNAHRVNKGNLPVLNEKSSDFFFMRRENTADITAAITELCTSRLPKAYGFDPMTDIQVLTPIRKSPIGVMQLNEALQAALNPQSHGQREKKFSDFTLREGDKVMQTKNNYDLPWQRGVDTGQGVYNGDMGVVVKMSKYSPTTVTVLFDDGREAIYDSTQASDLDLAYAVTVHKSQGNEFDCVIMPVYPCAPRLMTRNLFYTALTRAKKLVVLVGREESIAVMTKNNTQTKRYSGLADRLIEAN